MCFSATASFVASGALGAVGVTGLTQTKKKKEIPFAFLPLLFAVQQALEGVIWVSFAMPSIHTIATNAYLFFAYAFWPAFVPFSVRFMEPDPHRRKIMLPLVMTGTLVGLYGLYALIFFPTASSIYCNSLLYSVNVPYPIFGTMYVIALCCVFLFSTYTWVVAFGTALILSCILAYTFWSATGDSVWCFFAAILSGLVMLHIRSHRRIIVKNPFQQ